MLNKTLAWTDPGSANPEESFDVKDIGNLLFEGAEDAQEDTDRDQSEPVPQPEEALDDDEENPAIQQMLSSRADEPNSPIELYRRDGIIVVLQKDWRMELLIFQEMGWRPVRHLETYAHPLTFIKHDEGKTMQQAGRSFFALIRDEPFLSTSVHLDLGLFYKLTEFVGGGAFIVGWPGAYELAKTNGF